jgi:hypothetical protein
VSKNRTANPPAALVDGLDGLPEPVQQRDIRAIPGDPTYSPNAECGSKRRYADKEAAKRVSSYIYAKYGDRQEVYRCGHCGLFHLGHKPAAAARDQIITCAGCGRLWRPKVHYARDGTVIAVFAADPTRCRHCQPVPTPSDDINRELEQQPA